LSYPGILIYLIGPRKFGQVRGTELGTWNDGAPPAANLTAGGDEREDQEWKAAMIIQGILKARSPRITEVARAIPF